MLACAIRGALLQCAQASPKRLLAWAVGPLLSRIPASCSAQACLALLLLLKRMPPSDSSACSRHNQTGPTRHAPSLMHSAAAHL
eukprot:3800318-Amphidinium_carterae.2